MRTTLCDIDDPETEQWFRGVIAGVNKMAQNFLDSESSGTEHFKAEPITINEKYQNGFLVTGDDYLLCALQDVLTEDGIKWEVKS